MWSRVSSDGTDHHELLSNHEVDNEIIPSKRKRRFSMTWITLFISLLLNGYLISGPSFCRFSQNTGPNDYSRVAELKTVWAKFWWNTKYSPHNHTESDALWEQINPAHGFVAVDRTEAAQNNWPESMYLPSDHSKGVYLLEAYHQLHCLRILRQTFWEAVEGRPYTHKPLSHVEHCFDALRQSAICNADNSPLYTFGNFTAGDGQTHKCRSWEELRQYATENSACYRDSVEKIPLGDHFGFCEDHISGIDGVEEL